MAGESKGIAPSIDVGDPRAGTNLRIGERWSQFCLDMLGTDCDGVIS